MIFNLYIYNKSGICIYYEEWNRKKPSSNLAEEQKLLFGMLFSLKSFVTKTSPKPYPCTIVINSIEWYMGGLSLMRHRIDDKIGFHCYKTSTYKLHFYETLTNVKFIILTDPNTPDLREELKKLHSQIYVEYPCKWYRLADCFVRICVCYSYYLEAHI